MKKQTTFREKLQHQIFMSIIVIVVIAVLAFSVSIILFTYSITQKKADNYNVYLSDIFEGTYHDYANYLYAINNSGILANQLQTGLKSNEFIYSFYQDTAEFEISSDFILLDQAFNVQVSTLPDKYYNEHLYSFVKIMAQKSVPEEIGTAVYYIGDLYSQYIMCYPLMLNGEIGSYAFVLMSGDDWNNLITSDQTDGVIVDRFDNVIACSQKNFIQKFNRFELINHENVFTHSGQKYLMNTKYLRNYEITIYTFSLIPNQWDQFWIGIVIIVLLGAALLILAKRFANQIADSNTRSMIQLSDEMEKIKSDVQHRIEMDSTDEFKKIADGINSLISEINGLHVKNTELIDLRRQSEIKQLEAQFDPHFLYNTLDTIRYSILMDQRIASDLIIQLTLLLRYSVNNDIEQVYFNEDMRYLHVFLKIQKYRFNERFSYHIDIEEACGEFVVPKLMLQPILENSLKYGFQRRSALHIDIVGRVLDQTLTLRVSDNGEGIDEAEVNRLNALMRSTSNTSNHLGLFNIARRLFLTYGGHSSVTISSTLHQGVSVEVIIEKQKGAE